MATAYLDRRDRLAADQRTEVQQPFLAEEADVEINAIERAESADGIGAIFEDARRPDRVRRLKELRQIAFVDEIIELLVVQISAGERLFAPAFRELQTRATDRRRHSSCADC